MNLLLYSPEADADEYRLLNVIKKTEGIEIYRSPEAFKVRLSKPMHMFQIIVTIADRKFLSMFNKWGDLMQGYYLIMILADDSSETISLAHQFRPRYVTFKGDNLEDLGTVLERLILRCEREFIDN